MYMYVVTTVAIVDMLRDFESCIIYMYVLWL
jgi:hypothetical protein